MENQTPVLKGQKELADYIVMFWVECTRKPYFFKEKGALADLANMIVFIDAHEQQDTPLFSEEEIQLAKDRCLKEVEESFKSYGFSVCSESYGMGDFFEKVFGNKIHSRSFRIPELFMRYFDSEEKYKKSMGEKKGVKDFPGSPILCIRERGEVWNIIALVQLS